MKREAFVWLAALIVLIALWLAVPLAMRIFDPIQFDVEPGEFLGLGPPWFYLALLIDAVATVTFTIAIVIRASVLAIRLWRNLTAEIST